MTDHTKEIAKTPFMYKSTDFKDVRVASLGNFSIYYKITEESIIITAFWDNRQAPRKLLDIFKVLLKQLNTIKKAKHLLLLSSSVFGFISVVNTS